MVFVRLYLSISLSLNAYINLINPVTDGPFTFNVQCPMSNNINWLILRYVYILILQIIIISNWTYNIEHCHGNFESHDCTTQLNNIFSCFNMIVACPERERVRSNDLLMWDQTGWWCSDYDFRKKKKIHDLANCELCYLLNDAGCNKGSKGVYKGKIDFRFFEKTRKRKSL